jgi:hypothetical protein
MRRRKITSPLLKQRMRRRQLHRWQRMRPKLRYRQLLQRRKQLRLHQQLLLLAAALLLLALEQELRLQEPVLVLLLFCCKQQGQQPTGQPSIVSFS